MKLLLMLLSNGVTSIVSIILTFSLARWDGLAVLGEFALAYAALSILQVIVREACLNMALVGGSKSESPHLSFTRAIVIVAAGAILILGYGLISNSAIIMIMAWSAVAFCSYDFLRLYTAATGVSPMASVTDVFLLLSVSGAALASELGVIDGRALIISWSAALSISSVTLVMRSRLYPGLMGKPLFTKQSVLFGAEGVLGSGSASISYLLIGGLQSTDTVGILRGGSTFAGPGNLVTATIKSASIGPISHTSPATLARRKTIVGWFATSLLIQLPLLALSFVVAFEWGGALLGEAWPSVESVLLWMLADAALVAVAAPANAAHRADLRARRALSISIATGGLRILLVPLAAISGGAIGAVVTLFAISALNTVLLWSSYLLYNSSGSKL